MLVQLGHLQTLVLKINVLVGNGSQKPQAPERQNIRNAKNMFACSEDVQQVFSTRAVLKIIRKNHTAEEFEEHRKYLQSHCPCGAFKSWVDDREYIRCPVCNRIWCIIGNCNTTSTLMSNYISHNCLKCGYSKTREEKMKNCPQCIVYWCLISNCSYEHDTEAILVRHQTEAHFYF